VDEMLASMRTARDAALANGPALSHLTASLSEAKTKLEPVHQQWAANQAKLDAYHQSTTSSTGTPTTTPGVPPVQASQQNELHAQAASIMSTLASHTVEAQLAIRTPPPYEAPHGGKVDVVTPDPGSAASSRSRRSGTASPPSASPTTSSHATPSGSTLSGSRRPTSESTNSSIEPGPPRARTSGVEPSGRILGYPTPIPASGRATAFGGPSPEPNGGQGGRTTARNGIIGGPPSAVEELRPVRNGQRVNPVGGVIGSSTAQETGILGGPVGSGAAGGQRQRRRNPAYDSSDQWPVRTGVPPVLLPPDEPVHDPGPTLGQRP
jgi:hypothetical protein